MDSFNNYRLEDGSISKLCIEGADAKIWIRTWREEEVILVFTDMAGVESSSFINTSLSHGTETAHDSFLDKACQIGEEQPDNYRCFSFFSAWADTPILKIIARTFSVSTPG